MRQCREGIALSRGKTLQWEQPSDGSGDGWWGNGGSACDMSVSEEICCVLLFFVEIQHPA